MDELIDQYKKELVKVNGSNHSEVFMSKVNKTKENLLNVELEVKIHGANKEIFEQFEKLYEMQDLPVVKSINLMKQNDNNKETIIRTILFDGDKKIETNSRKRLLQNRRNRVNEHEYGITLSLEDSYNIKSAEVDLIRIKFRRSKIINITNYQWSLDLTYVHTSYNISNLKKIKDELFACNVAERTDIGYEIELELKNGNTQFTVGDLNAASRHLLQTINPNFENTYQLSEELNYICAQLGVDPTSSPTVKKIFPKVVSITRSEYNNIYPPKGYYITDKLDGKRAIMSIHDGKCYIVTDKLIEIEGEFPQKWTILDGEYYNKKFYAFDAIIIDDEKLMYKPFSERLERLKKTSHNVKKYTFITADKPHDLELEITEKRIGDEKTDGYIITKDGDDYMSTVNYKYKDLDHNTIDFLAKRSPTLSDVEGTTLYYLFVGISRKMFENLKLRFCPEYREIFNTTTFGEYFPIQFSSCNMPYAYKYYRDSKLEDIDGKIVELLCTENCGSMSTNKIVKWKEIGIREDRKNETNYYGNDFRIAELTWLNFVDPFTKEELWNGVKDMYFATEKESIYEAQISYINFCKSTLISDLLSNLSNVLDVAAGRGSDLGRYYKAKVKNLYAIDIDRSALSTLVQRRLSNSFQVTTAVNVMVADMNNEYSILVDRLHSHFELTTVDAIVCNLAVHYFLNSIEGMMNFVLFCSKMLKSGGIVILTCFFGEKIHELPAEWDIYQDNVLKYSIKKEYVGDTLGIGQKIGVKMPFSNGEYYSENMVNTTVLINEYKKFGFTLKSKKSLISYMDDFKSRNHSTILTDDDKKYIDLYGEIILIKK